MSDVMKIAADRKSELEKSILALENKISEIREEMATLDDFLEFGARLMGQDGKPTAPPAKATPSEAPAPKREVSGLPSLGASKGIDPFDQPDAVAASVSELPTKQRPISRPA